MTEARRPLAGLTDGLFILGAFVGSSLIFVVQPMIARQLLPTLGGAPAVWTTCMLFFQSCLLAGYAWAHFGPKLLGDRVHAISHVGLLALASVFLPLGIATSSQPSTDAGPAMHVLLILATSIGLPMCVLSATSPLLQRWHQAVNPERGDRVYRLYSIGNIASLIVLLAYPLVIEPSSTLRQQRIGWSWLFSGLAVVLALCAAARLARGPTQPAANDAGKPTVPWKEVAWWIALSAIPSSYLLGVTNYLTSDVAAVPFLWVLPLSLYLGAFSLAFAGKAAPDVVRHALSPALALICLVLVGCAYTVTSVPMTIMVHVGTFFILTLGCLAELYRRRPAGAALTGFYLWIAVGGVLGGAFNSLAAPRIFDTTLEYPIALLLSATLAIPWPRRDATDAASDGQRYPALFVRVMIIVVLIAATVYAVGESRLRFLLSPGAVMAALGVPIVLCFILRRRPIAFGLCAGTLAGAMLALGFAGQPAAETHRSFFGVHRVIFDDAGGFIQLYHGTTFHGQQTLDATTGKPTSPNLPLTYYHTDGPLGRVLKAVGPARIGVVGLGVGNIAAYAGQGQVLRYYEIDPIVIELAARPDLFTYLQAARDRGADVAVVEGDARLTLAQSEETFDLLILDAFSGDAIPAHLLTREAFEVYAKRLAPGGTLLVHISNRYLDLRHVVAAGAGSVGSMALVRDELLTPELERDPNRAASTWMVIPRQEPLTETLQQGGWQPVTGETAWTDDYIDLLGTLK